MTLVPTAKERKRKRKREREREREKKKNSIKGTVMVVTMIIVD